jgi:nucleotide-binding universal stress UspA family protein
MFSRILIPLDQSTLAEQALGTAASIARQSNGTISLILAHRRRPSEHAPHQWDDIHDPEEAIYLRKIADELMHGAGVPVDSATEVGSPVDVICRRTHDIGADLIVMTSHGRTGVSRLWMGSVADGVMRHASVPVLMVRPKEAHLHPSKEAQSFRRILVPWDGSTASCAILPAAMDLACAFDAVLLLARIVQPMPMYVYDAGLPAYPGVLIDPEQTTFLAESAREELTQLAVSLERQGARVETEVVVSESAAPALLALAKARNADAIAMTTNGRGVSRLIVGSVADKLMRGSELPILLFRPNAVGVHQAPHIESSAFTATA